MFLHIDDRQNHLFCILNMLRLPVIEDNIAVNVIVGGVHGFVKNSLSLYHKWLKLAIGLFHFHHSSTHDFLAAVQYKRLPRRLHRDWTIKFKYCPITIHLQQPFLPFGQ